MKIPKHTTQKTKERETKRKDRKAEGNHWKAEGNQIVVKTTGSVMGSNNKHRVLHISASAVVAT